MPRPRVFITGASGRLASALREALRHDFEVIGVSRQAADGFLGYNEFLNSVRLKDSDAILHTAWSCLPLQAEHNPDAFSTQDLPLLNRLTTAIERSGAAPWLGFLSTCAVYGDSLTHACCESDPPHPKGVYARDKLRAETLLDQWAAVGGRPLAILRLSNLYGFAYDPDKPQGVVAHMLHCLGHDQPFVMWGHDTLKDYLHVGDACEAIRRLLSARSAGLWNICSGQSTSLGELAALISSITGKSLAVHPRPPLSDMSWDVTCTLLSRTKLSTLGLADPMPLQDGIRTLVQGLGGIHPPQP